jgi:phosphatidate phosphatase
MISKETRSQLSQMIIDFSTVLLVSIVFILIFFYLNPFDRGFYCNDDSIRYPYKKEDTIPTWLLVLYGSSSAVLIIVLTEFVTNYLPNCIDKSKKSSFKQMGVILTAILIYAMGAMSTLLITEIGKRTIGRLRPHFFDICKPKWEEIECFENKTDQNGIEILFPKYFSSLVAY